MTDINLSIIAQVVAQLNQALNPATSATEANEFGFVPVPTGNGKIQYLFPNYDRVGAGQRPYWIMPGQTPNNPIIPPSEALKGKLAFVNLIDTNRGGQEKQKAEFWIESSAITYVLELGWTDDKGKINNATKSFLKSLSALSVDELKRPITIALSRLVDKPGFVQKEGSSYFVAKVLVTDVWKTGDSGEDIKVYDESGDIDALAGQQIILDVNEKLTGRPTLTPREKKQQQTYQVTQQGFMPAPMPQVHPPFPTSQQPRQSQTQQPSAVTYQINQLIDSYIQSALGGNTEIAKALLSQIFPGRVSRIQLNDLELQQFWNQLQKSYPTQPQPQPPQQQMVANGNNNWGNQQLQQQQSPQQPITPTPTGFAGF